jgi:hypothetical protein
MYICVTEVDKNTRIPGTVAPQRTGPSMPDVKGLHIIWGDMSTWPVEIDQNGTYLRAPKYYGTCDDDAVISISGVLEVLTEQDYLDRKEAEILARRPFASWVWDESYQQWLPPFLKPADAVVNGGTVRYDWDETIANWAPIED